MHNVVMLSVVILNVVKMVVVMLSVVAPSGGIPPTFLAKKCHSPYIFTIHKMQVLCHHKSQFVPILENFLCYSTNSSCCFAF
jgi:hypothetical protein